MVLPDRPELGAIATQPPTPAPTETPEPTYPLPCPDLYSEDVFPTFEISMEDDELAKLRAEATRDIEEWHPALFRHEAEEHRVEVRNRGNISQCGDKLQLAIAFNHVDREARFRGLRRINLDHGGCGLLDERLSLEFARDLGLPAQCANHARLYVNGEYEGVYVNLEAVNKEFLRRQFGPDGDDGNLWKTARDLKTNEDEEVDRTTLETFHEATDLASLDEVIDLDEAIREWAFEAILPATDNFWIDGWNFYLYEHPGRGFLFIPRDLDKALPYRDAWVVFDPVEPVRQHPATVVLADGGWQRRYRAALDEMLAAYDPAWFQERVDRWWPQIAEAAADDRNLSIEADDPPPRQPLGYLRARARWLRERLYGSD